MLCRELELNHLCLCNMFRYTFLKVVEIQSKKQMLPHPMEGFYKTYCYLLLLCYILLYVT